MRALCVDDALPIMEDTVAMCKKLPDITSVTGFTRPREALEWLEDHPVDLALDCAGGALLGGGRLGETDAAQSAQCVRVRLGAGEGHNWWGLVFPQLCLPAAQEEPLQEVLAGDGFALLAEEEGVKLKFFLLELWDRLLNCLR